MLLGRSTLGEHPDVAIEGKVALPDTFMPTPSPNGANWQLAIDQITITKAA
jgi:hypothetical protein